MYISDPCVLVGLFFSFPHFLLYSITKTIFTLNHFSSNLGVSRVRTKVVLVYFCLGFFFLHYAELHSLTSNFVFLPETFRKMIYFIYTLNKEKGYYHSTIFVYINVIKMKCALNIFCVKI